MAYQKLKRSEAAKRSRKSVSRFERTPEWKMMKADLDKGLKPDEVLQVLFSLADQTKYKIHSRRSIARFLQKHLAERKLHYKVSSFERGEDYYILVQAYKPR